MRVSGYNVNKTEANQTWYMPGQNSDKPISIITPDNLRARDIGAFNIQDLGKELEVREEANMMDRSSFNNFTYLN